VALAPIYNGAPEISGQQPDGTKNYYIQKVLNPIGYVIRIVIIM